MPVAKWLGLRLGLQVQPTSHVWHGAARRHCPAVLHAQLHLLHRASPAWGPIQERIHHDSARNPEGLSSPSEWAGLQPPLAGQSREDAGRRSSWRVEPAWTATSAFHNHPPGPSLPRVRQASSALQEIAPGGMLLFEAVRSSPGEAKWKGTPGKRTGTSFAMGLNRVGGGHLPCCLKWCWREGKCKLRLLCTFERMPMSWRFAHGSTRRHPER
mmetsp:Transcript_83557/g.194281  ORF Transcript_83557/g.194281 Transcript_83557/m.194281 type:complete len:213 (+) Transcript_83557:1127-1765(+)